MNEQEKAQVEKALEEPMKVTNALLAQAGKPRIGEGNGTGKMSHEFIQQELSAASSTHLAFRNSLLAEFGVEPVSDAEEAAKLLEGLYAKKLTDSGRDVPSAEDYPGKGKIAYWSYLKKLVNKL